MFSLIITLISIALVAALAVATIYYGGDAFNRGQARATAATMVNQAQQIAGAWTLYEQDNAGTDVYQAGVNGQADLQILVTDGYLSSIPTVPSGADADASWDGAEVGTGWDIADGDGLAAMANTSADLLEPTRANDALVVAMQNEAVCDEINQIRDADAATIRSAGATVQENTANQFECFGEVAANENEDGELLFRFYP